MYAFVNFSHPEQQRSKAARKAIKAFTTKTNHARRRQRALEENARLPSKDSGSSSSSAAGDRDAPEDEVEAIVRRTDWNDVVIVKVPDWRESPLVKRSQKRLLDSSLLSPEGRFRDDPFGSFPVVSDPYLTDYCKGGTGNGPCRHANSRQSSIPLRPSSFGEEKESKPAVCTNSSTTSSRSS